MAFRFLIFLPILWMVPTSIKTELNASAMAPKFLLFHWTTETYATAQERSDYLHHALNYGSQLFEKVASPAKRLRSGARARAAESNCQL